MNYESISDFLIVEFKIIYLHKVCMFCISDSYNSVYFLDEFLFLVIIKVHIPFSQTSLAGTVLDKDKTNLRKNIDVKTQLFISNV